MPDFWHAYVDGGCHPNPNGTMGVGVALYAPDGTILERISKRPPGKGTNNQAEYLAILEALHAAAKHDIPRLVIFADSKLTVNTLNGRWRIREPRLAELKKRIDAALSPFRVVEVKWVPREKNTVADELATKAVGGTTTGARKYGDGPKTQAGANPANAVPRAKAEPEGALCAACKSACTFTWQRFKNGTLHIRQECPNHGFLRYAPNESPFTDVAGDPPR